MLSTPPILDGDLLAAFAAFAQARNFTRAAREVGLSQPALFERVRRLAELVGAPLYERRGRDLVLTAQGQQVAAYAREALDRAAAVDQALRGEAPREAVALAAGEGSFLYLLGPAIEGFVREERATLSLLTLGARDACEAVLTGEAALAVAALDLIPRGLVAQDIARTPLCAAMQPSHPLARKRSVSLEELAAERLVLPPPGRSHRDFIGRAITRLGREVAPPIEADGWPLMLRFAGLGLGVAVVNGICELPESVVSLPVPELGTVTYRLLRRRGARLTDAAERLAERVLRLAKR